MWEYLTRSPIKRKMMYGEGLSKGGDTLGNIGWCNFSTNYSHTDPFSYTASNSSNFAHNEIYFSCNHWKWLVQPSVPITFGLLLIQEWEVLYMFACAVLQHARTVAGARKAQNTRSLRRGKNSASFYGGSRSGLVTWLRPWPATDATKQLSNTFSLHSRSLFLRPVLNFYSHFTVIH